MKIVHMADAHLGYRQYGFRARELDFERAVEYIVDKAIEIKADAFLWAGDIFDSPTPSADSVYFVYSMVQKLHEHNIESSGVDGNHDACGGQWLRVCGIETFNIPVAYPIGDITIAGLGYARPTETMAKLETWVNDYPLPKVDILLLHQPLGDMSAFGGPITAEWLARLLKPLGVQYVALGDIHNFQLREIDGIMFAYPGSVEMTDIDEDPVKRFIVVEFTEGKRSKVEYFDIPTRKILRYELKTEADLAAMVQQVKEAEHGFALPVITVDAALPGGVERVQQALGGEIPHRLLRAAEADALKQKFSDPNWDRKGSIVDLKAAVTAAYNEQTEEFQLISELLARPRDVRPVISKYLNTKGITL